MPVALHNPKSFNSALNQWKKLGVIHAHEIVKEGQSKDPNSINYHMRVSQNDTRSGFGQVDKEGRLQGIGREVQDYIYEGQFKNNVFHGWGRYINDTGVYWGMYNQGLRNGNGKFLGLNGESKEGNWVNGILK